MPSRKRFFQKGAVDILTLVGIAIITLTIPIAQRLTKEIQQLTGKATCKCSNPQGEVNTTRCNDNGNVSQCVVQYGACYWRQVQVCSYGCSNGNCNPEPEDTCSSAGGHCAYGYTSCASAGRVDGPTGKHCPGTTPCCGGLIPTSTPIPPSPTATNTPTPICPLTSCIYVRNSTYCSTSYPGCSWNSQFGGMCCPPGVSPPTSTPIPNECSSPDDCEAPGRCNVACSGSPRRCSWTTCPTATSTPTATLTPTPTGICCACHKRTNQSTEECSISDTSCRNFCVPTATSTPTPTSTPTSTLTPIPTATRQPTSTPTGLTDCGNFTGYQFYAGKCYYCQFPSQFNPSVVDNSLCSPTSTPRPTATKIPTAIPTLEQGYRCDGNNLMYGREVVDTCEYGCDPQIGCRPPPSDCGNYRHGSTRCVDNQSYQICENGIWLAPRNCPNGRVCYDNLCQEPRPTSTSTPIPTPVCSCCGPLNACNGTNYGYGKYGCEILERCCTSCGREPTPTLSIPTPTSVLASQGGQVVTPSPKPSQRGIHCEGNLLMDGNEIIDTCNFGCNSTELKCNPIPANLACNSYGAKRCGSNGFDLEICDYLEGILQWKTLRRCSLGCSNNKCNTAFPIGTREGV